MAQKSTDGKFSKEIELNRRYFIVGERRISSYWWASVFLVGGFGFLITGISSYIKYNLFTNVYRIIEAFINKSSEFFLTLKTLFSTFIFSFGEISVPEVGQNSQILLLKEMDASSLATSIPFGAVARNIPYSTISQALPPLASYATLGEQLPSSGSGLLLGGSGGESLVFFPQGLLLCFYGSLGILLSLYWWLLIYWNVGGGFNEFNKKEGFMRIFRWGYPGKNRRIDIVYPLKDIEAIRVELNQSPGSGLLTAEQTIFIRLLSTPSVSTKEQEKEQTFSVEKGKVFLPEKGIGGLQNRTLPLNKKGLAQQVGAAGVEKLKEKREIPLGGIGQPLTLKEIEKQASELANYLQVALEGL